MNLREDWQFRGLVHQTTDDGVLDGLSAGGLTAYIGFDPTGSSLHLGNLMQICLLRRLQLAGNRPIALAGGGTGLIGDPSFKDTERPLLTRELLHANIEAIGAQLSRFLDFSAGAGASQALLLNNDAWLTTISLTDFLRDVGKHFTVNQMIAKEAVRSRLERDDVGLSFTEFSYMLLQAYDFLRLHEDYGCTVQLGGSDQWGNITAGAELVRKVTRHSVHAVTTPLLLRPDGRKFGKSESGNEQVWLDATMTSPYTLYQFLLNSDDATMPALLRFYTFLSHDEITELDASVRDAPQERRAQRALADAVVAMVHGEGAAQAAQRAGEALFGEHIAQLDEATLLDVMSDAPSSKWSREELAAGVEVSELLVRCGLAKSKGEARRFLEQGGVYVNNRRVDAGADEEARVDLSTALHDRYLVVRRGRRELHLVVVA
ncbi:MAG TPA: tyrosine--tRNA ligase [Acidimicrobiales bacterium]|nr:tyrosine--tRNA ligase [Acidimicrobiales bacterium]